MKKSKAIEWLNSLTNAGVIAGIALLAYELNQNAAPMRAEAISLLRFTFGMGVDMSNLRQSFIADLRRIAKEEGMPAPNEDGNWPE